MKNLLKNIWNAPASTSAGALMAALTYVLAADVEMPKWALVSIGATSAALAVFSGSSRKEEGQ
jgi:hypothetical protein